MKLLFVCTHNRCRSILAEAIGNQLAKGVLEVRSAGSQPAGEVHPDTLKYLQIRGYKTENLQSQSWDDFTNWNADFVITVCDSAAQESCPLWMGQGTKVHWPLKDPSKMVDEKKKRDAFIQVISQIEAGVNALTKLTKEKKHVADITTDDIRNALSNI